MSVSLFPYIVPCGLILSGSLDGVGQKAEDGSDPQQDGEAAEQLPAELHPLRGGGWRGQGIGSVADQELSSLGVSQTLYV